MAKEKPRKALAAGQKAQDKARAQYAYEFLDKAHTNDPLVFQAFLDAVPERLEHLDFMAATKWDDSKQSKDKFFEGFKKFPHCILELLKLDLSMVDFSNFNTVTHPSVHPCVTKDITKRGQCGSSVLCARACASFRCLK